MELVKVEFKDGTISEGIMFNNDIILNNVNITTKYTTRHGLDIFNNYTGILTKEDIDARLEGYNKYQIFNYTCNGHMHIGIANEVDKELVMITYNFYTKETIDLDGKDKVEENTMVAANSINVIDISKAGRSEYKSKCAAMDSLTPFVKFKINGIAHYGIMIYSYHHLYFNLPKQTNIFVYPALYLSSDSILIKSDIPNPSFYIITTSRIEYCNCVYALNIKEINKITDISITSNDSKEIASSIDEAIKDFLR